MNYNHIILLDYKINVMSKKNALKIWGRWIVWWFEGRIV